MRTRITLIICLCLFAVGRASAQWAVIDPSNIAQSIVNTSKNVVHTYNPQNRLFVIPKRNVSVLRPFSKTKRLFLKQNQTAFKWASNPI